MHIPALSTLLAWSATVLPAVSAIQLSQNPSRDELINAANQAKENMLSFYGGDKPGGVPGYMLKPDVYFWWEVGGMLGQLIQHWHLTGNDSHNDLIKTALQFQSQDNNYLQPKNQSNSEGNDDQVFWAYAAMDAAEYNFPAPDASTGLSWLGLAQAVFNVQQPRWETSLCGGGLRWQIYPWNKGYNYKNMPTNGGLFQLSARLYRYTGNGTYQEWADRIWDWATQQKLIAPSTTNQNAMHVYDGFDTDHCSSFISPTRFTYNAGTMIMGTAYMYNATSDQKWLDRLNSLMAGIADNVYLVQSIGENANNGRPGWGGQILSETAMELQTPQSLNNDQPTFKAYTVRWLAVAGQLVPPIQDKVSAIIRASAQGAAAQCTGPSPGGPGSITPTGLTTAPAGSSNNWCGRRWYQTKWDGYSGFGEQMSAMSVFQNHLLELANGQSAGGGQNAGIAPPLTANTGGTSQSQPGAGSNAESSPLSLVHLQPITTGDRVGAAIATIGGLALPVAALWFMMFGS